MCVSAFAPFVVNYGERKSVCMLLCVCVNMTSNDVLPNSTVDVSVHIAQGNSTTALGENK